MSTYLRLTGALLDVLSCLVHADENMWGLRVSTLSGRPTGTVYPLLDRLESAGFVRSWWDDDEARPGPRRRLYALTAEGRRWATTQLAKKGRSVPESTTGELT